MVSSIARLIVAAFFLATVLPERGLAQEEPETPPTAAPSAAAPPTVGCSWAPKADGSAAVETDDDEDDDDGDDEDEDDEDENEPKIVGSVPAPPRGQRSRAALQALVTVERDQAVQIAWGAIPDPVNRRVIEVELGIEHGYVIWEVEFGYQRGHSGPDRFIEVYVDVGNGQVLLIECEH